MEIIPLEWEQHRGITVWERTLAWFMLQNALAQAPRVDNVKYLRVFLDQRHLSKNDLQTVLRGRMKAEVEFL